MDDDARDELVALLRTQCATLTDAMGRAKNPTALVTIISLNNVNAVLLTALTAPEAMEQLIRELLQANEDVLVQLIAHGQTA